MYNLSGDYMQIIKLILSFFFVLGLALHGLPYLFYPTVEFDLSDIGTEPDISSRACGFLYGLAQEGVPSPEAVKTLTISSISQKVIGGLQHPIGDVDDVSPNLGTCDYITVYLQDCYPTWYYNWDVIEEMRKAGTYDCREFVENDFLPQAREKVRILSQKDYADRLVYCPYNECDNTVWFGTQQEGGWLAFDDKAKAEFYRAWKLAYEEIRAIHPGSKIGGPGYCDYNIDKIGDFLKFCKENDCLPDIMIYHELGGESSMWLRDHVKEYRKFEKELGIKENPIIITEYGTMEECGVPSPMLHYISAMEDSGVYGNIAYWRLSDNLCDTITKGNCPNSCWWLYKWYCDMRGKHIPCEVLDLKHSDFENTVKYFRDGFHKSKLDGIGACDIDNKRIDLIIGGADYSYQAALRGADRIFGKSRVRVTVEAVAFEGLSGEVFKPSVISDKVETASANMKIRIDTPDINAVYHVIIEPYGGEKLLEAAPLPERFEFENGTLLGKAYTYDSAYGTTDGIQGMCGGFENDGDGISLDFNTGKAGKYDISIVYGKANDGTSTASRCDGRAKMIFDGEESEISLPNTVKSEYTDKYTFTADLSAGKHNIRLMHSDGTFVVDSLLILPHTENESVYCKYDNDCGEYLIIAPANGFYKIGNADKYLKKGFNYVKDENGGNIEAAPCGYEDEFTAELNKLALSGTAEIKTVGGRDCLTGINSDGGSAAIEFNASREGIYAITLEYSNNEENGLHAYNVDLIEEYVTITAGDEKHELWCVNTLSDYNFSTATAYIRLNEGMNEIVLSNDHFNSFNGITTTSPNISRITINRAEK